MASHPNLQRRRHNNAASCQELYTEALLAPRVAVLSIVVLMITIAAVRLQRRHLARRNRQVATINLDGYKPVLVTNEAGAMNPHAREAWVLQRFRLTIVIGFVWTTMIFISFQTNDFRSGTDGSGPERPRVVFSFTKTANGIDHIEPTLAALVNQDGEGFDAIYVVVSYRKKTMAVLLWLLTFDSFSNKTSSDFHGWKSSLTPSSYHDRVHVLVIDKDFGPASKVLGMLLVEQDPETIIVYGDDDRAYPRELAARALDYAIKFPEDAIAVLGGWIGVEGSLYCGRSLEVGINRVPFVGGAGGVVVRRKFHGLGVDTTVAFAVREMSKACFLGDDYHLSLVLSRNKVRRRLVYDSCWKIELCGASYSHSGLSGESSLHPGSTNA